MEIKKALTFRASSIGDCLMGKYLLENVHAAYPSARLALVVGSRGAMIRDVFAAYPWLEVVEANRRNPSSLLSLFKHFYGSDLVVTQYAGKQGGTFSFASKIAARLLARGQGLIGFSDASQWNGLYDELIPVRADMAVAEHDRAALRAAGIPIALPFPHITCVPDDSILAKFGVTSGNYVVVHLFAGSKKRELHPDRKRELLTALLQQFPHQPLIVSGSIADREEALRISENIPVTVIAGEATLQDMMNLIKNSRGIVSVDTGMAHLAAQLGVRLMVLRTCIGRNWWLPGQYGNQARIAIFERDETCVHGHHHKDYPDCINGISVSDAVSLWNSQ